MADLLTIAGVAALSSLTTIAVIALFARRAIRRFREREAEALVELAAQRLGDALEQKLRAGTADAAEEIERGVQDAVEQALRRAARGDLAVEAGRSVLETAADTLLGRPRRKPDD